MKIYVDKMPKCCDECCFCKLNTYVDIYKEQINSYECVLGGSMLTNNCPLLTTQFLKQQAREGVLDEIKKRFAKQRTKMQDNTHCYPQTVVHWQDVVAVLDQVKGESNDN